MFIGGTEIKGFAALAPMAGVADMAFRELCVEYGAAYVVSEMVSSKGVAMHDRKSGKLMMLSEKERPAAIQIFGSDPATMAGAAVKAQNFTCDIIDINMGCPAPKIVNNGNGSALMKNPALAGEITAACVKAVNLPVTVKIRTGWDENSLNAVEVAALCEQAGASAITVHGRTRAQMYAPPVNRDMIKAVKDTVKIPVIGNGDIVDPLSAEKMLEETGCDLLMVGRGALGRPWVFSQINEYFKTGVILPEPDIEERMNVLMKHVLRLCEYKGEYIGMMEARKHAAWYIRDIRGAASFRNEIGRLSSPEELEALIKKVLDGNVTRK